MNAISIGQPFSPWRSTTSDRTLYLPSPIPNNHSQFRFLHKQRNHRSLFLSQSSMSSSNYILASNQNNQTELITESDFEQIVSPDGTLSICGFGSLLSGILSIAIHLSKIFCFNLKPSNSNWQIWINVIWCYFNLSCLFCDRCFWVIRAEC